MKESKQEKLIKYFIKNSKITSWEAIQKFRITRLSGVIFNLKKKGWVINSKKVEKENYAIYTLKEIGIYKPKSNSFNLLSIFRK